MSTNNRGNRGGTFWRGKGRGRGWRPYNKQPKPVGNKTFAGNSNNSNVGNIVSTPNCSRSSQQQVSDIFEAIPCPYSGWKLYHTKEAYKEGSSTVIKIQSVERFIRKNIKSYSASDIMERRAFAIDVKSLLADEDFNESWPTFKEELFEKPDYTLNNLGLAMHQVAVKEIENKLKRKLSQDNAPLPAVNVPIIRARITGYEPVLQLKNLKANYYNKMVAIHGTIIRVGNIKLLCVWLAFECMSCHGLQCIKQPEGTYTPPTKCRSDKCRSRQFLPLHSSPYTQTVNWQSVRVQEIVADDQREGGRVPRTIECELTEDLLDSCLPGDVVSIIGVIKVRNNEEFKKQKAPSMFLLYLEGVSVINSKSHSLSSRNSAMGVKLDGKDFCAIKEIRSQPSLFRLLVHSLCPTIYGHELVKAGLLLTLFGGSQKHADSRCDPHILVVGDPGLGKSQMLQACSSVAPRGVYVCGNTSTSTGLTVTLTRESGGDYALEAGALVLADQGCCCIDEFDKMTTQHAALLEVMEQQSVSIAKAGVVCSLPARTSILAAANPSGGHYNRAKTVSENLRIGPALLSRFDLVFILLDKPNEHLDSLLSEHVMALHSGMKHALNQSLSQLSGTSRNSQNSESDEKQLSLGERLKLRSGEAIDPVPHQLLRKYLAYARKYIHPILSSEAAEVIQKFYLELRKEHHTMDSTPVTTRQLESLIRLTEARAKVELRENVTVDDALDVVEVMRHSLVDTYSDGISLDFRRSQNGSGLSSKNQAKKFINALQKRADIQNRSVFSSQELKEVSELSGVQVSDFGNFISSLNVQGFLLKKGPKLYQLLTVDY
ncbi:DNA replication licensing factor REC [Gryllus bimaculatus]|nr:DNA replication licensing factor REC [Gryllus bimaculatus]